MQNNTKGVHYLDSYLIDPPHKISVSVIGTGGTGSQVLVTLARINAALIALGRIGLQVEAWDPDEVSETNIGRQHFSPKDIGKNKAEVLVTRINRYFGTDWEAIPETYVPGPSNQTNIVISCVDSVKTRECIYEYKNFSNRDPFRNMMYWLDFGNNKDRGQAILTTKKVVEQPKSSFITHSEIKSPIIWSGITEDESEPSCSMQEALMSQDLLVNSTLVMHGMTLLWRLLKEYRTFDVGVYLNTREYRISSIKI